MRRFLLVLLLVNGLVPAFGEVVEAVVHRVTVGHFAHDQDQEHDRGEPPGEHGCGTTTHLCRCCPNQPVVAVARGLSPHVGLATKQGFPGIRRPATEGHVRGPFRPPIG